MKTKFRFLTIIFLLVSFIGTGIYLSMYRKDNPVTPFTKNTSSLTPITVISLTGGTFTMGDGSYGPNVSQTVSNFKIGKYTITNTQYGEFITDGGYSNSSYWTTNGWSWKTTNSKTQPGYWTDAMYNQANQPVVGVSWYESVAFCHWRSIKDGLTPAYNASGQATLTATGYRLPTEVEWEYAAAKGDPSAAERIYSYGSTWDCTKVVNSTAPCSASVPAVVGSKSPGGDTPQGLVDMSGNVWQWISDNYQADGSVVGGTKRYYFIDD